MYTLYELKKDLVQMVIGFCVVAGGILVGTQVQYMVIGINVVEFVIVFIGVYLMVTPVINRLLGVST